MSDNVRENNHFYEVGLRHEWLWREKSGRACFWSFARLKSSVTYWAPAKKCLWNELKFSDFETSLRITEVEQLLNFLRSIFLSKEQKYKCPNPSVQKTVLSCTEANMFQNKQGINSKMFKRSILFIFDQTLRLWTSQKKNRRWKTSWFHFLTELQGQNSRPDETQANKLPESVSHDQTRRSVIGWMLV